MNNALIKKLYDKFITIFVKDQKLFHMSVKDTVCCAVVTTHCKTYMPTLRKSNFLVILMDMLLVLLIQFLQSIGSLKFFQTNYNVYDIDINVF